MRRARIDRHPKRRFAVRGRDILKRCEWVSEQGDSAFPNRLCSLCEPNAAIGPAFLFDGDGAVAQWHATALLWWPMANLRRLPPEPPSSEITPEPAYQSRREFLRNAARTLGTAAVVGGGLSWLLGQSPPPDPP